MALCVSAGAGAQGTLESRVLGCAGIQSRTERLACYDGLAAELSGAKSGPQSPQADAAEATFGLKAGSGVPAAKRDTLHFITSRVRQIQARGDGGVLLVLDNGQTWEELGSSDLELNAGDRVRISRASLGSFWLTTSAHLGARVRRVR